MRTVSGIALPSLHDRRRQENDEKQEKFPDLSTSIGKNGKEL
jgi:hypothetical protein